MGEAFSGERLRLLLDYDPINGAFKWRQGSYRSGLGAASPGDTAGRIDDKGYVIICFDDRSYKAHRLAWFYMTNAWPDEQVDHADGDKSNNRWANLRHATNGQNKANTRMYKNNTSGYKGVFQTESGRFRSTIRVNGKLVNLGTFLTAPAAYEAYCVAARKFFGEFARVA